MFISVIRFRFPWRSHVVRMDQVQPLRNDEWKLESVILVNLHEVLDVLDVCSALKTFPMCLFQAGLCIVSQHMAAIHAIRIGSYWKAAKIIRCNLGFRFEVQLQHDGSATLQTLQPRSNALLYKQIADPCGSCLSWLNNQSTARLYAADHIQTDRAYSAFRQNWNTAHSSVCPPMMLGHDSWKSARLNSMSDQKFQSAWFVCDFRLKPRTTLECNERAESYPHVCWTTEYIAFGEYMNFINYTLWYFSFIHSNVLDTY